MVLGRKTFWEAGKNYKVKSVIICCLLTNYWGNKMEGREIQSGEGTDRNIKSVRRPEWECAMREGGVGGRVI